MAILRANLLVLRCADVDASRAFYEALGLSMTPERHGHGPPHYSTRLGDLVLELYPVGVRSTSGLRVGLVSSDVAEAVARVRDAGGEVVEVDAQCPPRHATLKDLDGHTLVLTAEGGPACE